MQPKLVLGPIWEQNNDFLMLPFWLCKRGRTDPVRDGYLFYKPAIMDSCIEAEQKLLIAFVSIYLCWRFTS